jgi:twitching motility protein PilT
MYKYFEQEKRRLPRIYLQSHVQCQIINPRDKSVKERVLLSKNINSDGIALESDEIIPLDTEIEINFKLPKSERNIEAAIRIVRLEAGRDNKVILGAVFTRISEKDRSEIKRVVSCFDISQLLALAIQHKASDLHILVDHPPVLRIQGQLKVLSDMPEFAADEIPSLLFSMLSKQQIRAFEEKKELDFGLQFDTDNRFRVNLHQQKGFLEATFRLINVRTYSFEDLNIPPVVKDLALLKDGLVLIVGPTGSGKTTTIATMIEYINRQREVVIISLERPIEYLYTHGKSIIKQREVGVDTASFSVALKSSLRQDPNVIVVGELDDTETIKTALIAAEAGYLVIASFHAQNTIQAIDRLANMFPPENRKQLFNQLSHCLKGIIAQMLIPAKTPKRIVLASEVLIATEAVKRIIRNDELIQLSSVIQTGSTYNMRSMADSLKALVDNFIIDQDTASKYSEEYSRYLRQ